MTDAPERIWIDKKVGSNGFHGHDYKNNDNDIEYIRKDISIKLRNEWFNRGLKAGKISNNKSGCCCVFEDDGETITNMCAPHKAMIETEKQDALKPIRKVWEKWKWLADKTGRLGIVNIQGYLECVAELWQAIKTALGEK